MKFDVYNAQKKVREIELSNIWESASSKCVHQVIVARLANERQGTASTKTRAEVRGTGAKPFRQKGLGRARRGSSYSPLLRGGGVTFGPKPRDYTQHINKKQKANAYVYVIAELYRKGGLKIVESLELKDSKTKSFKALSVSVLNKQDLLFGEGIMKLKCRYSYDAHFLALDDVHSIVLNS